MCTLIFLNKEEGGGGGEGEMREGRWEVEGGGGDGRGRGGDVQTVRPAINSVFVRPLLLRPCRTN